MEKAFPEAGIPVHWQTAHRRQFTSWAEEIAFPQNGSSPFCSLAGATSKDRWEISQGRALHSAQTKPQCRQWLQITRGLHLWGLLVPQDQDLPPVCAGAQIFPSWAQGASHKLTHFSSKVWWSSLATGVSSLPQHLMIIVEVNVWRLRCIL